MVGNAQNRSAIQLGQPTPPWGSITTDQLGYDGAARLIGKRYFNGSSVIIGFTSAYDKSGNKLFERPLHVESRASLYDSYDSMNRLLDYERGTLASGGGSISTPIALPGTNREQGYNLDGLGNWTSTTITPEGGSPATQDRTHNKLNEVTQYGVPPASTPVLYDHGNNSGSGASRGNGNIADDGIRTYAYDALNRLTTVNRKSDGKLIGQYTYDALGRRIRKTVSNGGLSGTITNGTTRYLYDSNQCVEELNASNSTTRQFIWGQYIDELIQLKTYVPTGSQPLPAGVYYLLSDLLYRSSALTNGSAAIVEAYDTDAYGNTLMYSAAGTGGNWFANNAAATLQPACETIFTGRQYDPESQIYFYRARYYHPPLGRFVSRDPINYLAGLNLYEYVDDEPTILLDPNGTASSPTTSPTTQPTTNPSSGKDKLGINCPDGKEPCPKPKFSPSFNGCGGSRWQVVLLLWGVKDASFYQDACNCHDICYQTCTGDQKHKQYCDDNLLTDVAQICENKFSNPADKKKLEECLLEAAGLKEAVKKFGADAYNTDQQNACTCCDCPTTKASTQPTPKGPTTAPKRSTTKLSCQ